MNLLIAEDSAPLRRMIRRIVARADDRVFECADGEAALAAYVEHRPDWVLMDIKMPKMDGLAATRAICAINPLARVVVVTSYDDPFLRSEAEVAGAVAFVVKDDLSRLRSLLAAQTVC